MSSTCFLKSLGLRLFDTKASLYEKKGDLAEKKLTLKEELQYAKKLPKSQISASELPRSKRRRRSNEPRS